MKILDTSTLDASVSSPGVLPIDLSMLEGKLRCLFLGQLEGPVDSWVADFELDPKDVDFSKGETMTLLGDLNLWLKSTVRSQLDASNVMVNLDFRQ